MKSTAAIEAVAGADDMLELLPKNPAEAETTLDMVEGALARPGKQPDRLVLRTRAPEDGPDLAGLIYPGPSGRRIPRQSRAALKLQPLDLVESLRVLPLRRRARLGTC